MALPTDIHPFVQFAGGATADLGNEISQSLRFDGNGFLTRGQLSSGDGLLSNNRTFTFSTWFKHGSMGETNIFGIHPASGNDNWLLTFANFSNPSFAGRDNATSWGQYSSSAVFRDPNAWYHLFLTCSSGVLSLRVNNVLQDQTDTQNHSMDRDFVLGAEGNSGATKMTAYLAETYFIQGTVMDAVNDGFIRLNTDGVYVPSTPTISSYGTNGWHLTYDSSQANGIGHDSSGNGNHFTASGFDTAAISSSNFDNDIDYNDTPTSNFATMNPLHTGGVTLSDGNLTGDVDTSATKKLTTQGMTSGKFYWEVTYTDLTAGGSFGLARDPNSVPGGHVGSDANSWAYLQGGDAYHNGTTTSYGDSYAVNDILSVAFNADDGELFFYKNGTIQNSGTAAFTGLTDGPYFPAIGDNSSSTSSDFKVNFGQRSFIYTIPTGYTALQTNNLPEPTIKDGKKHFGIMLYTGDGGGSGAGNVITDTDAVDFTPDMVWIKKRANGSGSTSERDHVVFDSVRGKDNGYYKVWRPSDTNGGTEGSPQHLSNIGDGTITVHDITSGEVNQLNNTFVAWCWKAGGAPTATNTSTGSDAPTSGSVMINDVASTTGLSGTIKAKKISANTTSGFSIVQYTGNSTGGATVDHGLTSTPEFIIIKCLTTNPTNPTVLNTAIGTNGDTSFGNAEYNVLYLNSDSQSQNNSSDLIFPGNSTTFALGEAGSSYVNANQDYIAYVWHSVPGFSKFGAYTGNNNADGPFIYTGFEPAWLMTKRTDNSSGGEWAIFDSKRNTLNPTNLFLASGGVNGNNNESTYDIDFLSNGFKLRGSGGYPNQSGSYVYFCFAENPFGGENQPPAPAR